MADTSPAIARTTLTPLTRDDYDALVALVERMKQTLQDIGSRQYANLNLHGQVLLRTLYADVDACQAALARVESALTESHHAPAAGGYTHV